ncbi:MAG: HlyD family type I secretion periplasmic adaptor subunit [Moraxellaceae bacterium]|nr:HlyD family type I secretion periplasmic adaptor subunit [Moraxellaceae bacterium]
MKTPAPPSTPVGDFWADAGLLLASPRARYARAFVWSMLGLLVVMLVWAALATVDEVARGQGRVIPSSHVQVVQSLDGGIVSGILVQEGNIVEKGQLLLRIDPTRFASSLQENESQVVSLQAKAARLRAIAENRPFVLPEGLETAFPELAEAERSLYLARRQELQSGVGIALQQLEQRTQEMNEVISRRNQAAESFTLTQRELTMTRELSGSGAVSDVEILRLQRDAARFRGERDTANAQISRLESAINEARRKRQETELTFRNQARMELSETMGKLQGLRAGTSALQDKVDRTEVRAPMHGTVKRLLVTTVGGVIQPGKDLIEIVPLNDNLLLEARIQPRDIAFLRPGQKAVVRFTAYDFSIYGGLEATLEHIAADTVTDDKGNAFYVVHVRTHQSWVGSDRQPILPGMVADVDILTGKRSVLSYLLKPVLRARNYALSER